jgi:hypothetical protein
MQGIPEDLKRHALARLSGGDHDVGAAVWHDISEPWVEGRAFRTIVTDGEAFELVDWVDARAPRIYLLSEPIEAAVEDRICSICPDDARMPMVRALGLWFENGRIPIRLGLRAVPATESEAEAREPKAA